MKFFKRKKKKFKTIKKKEYSPFLVKIDKAIKELTVEYSSKSRKDFLEEVKFESRDELFQSWSLLCSISLCST